MKWVYAIQQKMTAALVLGALFLLLIFSNFIQNRDFQQLDRNFAAIYEDRLLAEGYLFRLSTRMHQESNLLKEAVLSGKAPSASGTTIASLDAEIFSLLSDYEKTRLTKAEETLFLQLRQKMNELQSGKQNYYAAAENEQRSKQAVLMQRDMELALSILSDLSEIQITEGKKLKENTNVVFLGNKASMQLETVVLILLGLLIQAIVFASKTVKMSKKPAGYQLN